MGDPIVANEVPEIGWIAEVGGTVIVVPGIVEANKGADVPGAGAKPGANVVPGATANVEPGVGDVGEVIIGVKPGPAEEGVPQTTALLLVSGSSITMSSNDLLAFLMTGANTSCSERRLYAFSKTNSPFSSETDTH